MVSVRSPGYLKHRSVNEKYRPQMSHDCLNNCDQLLQMPSHSNIQRYLQQHQSKFTFGVIISQRCILTFVESKQMVAKTPLVIVATGQIFEQTNTRQPGLLLLKKNHDSPTYFTCPALPFFNVLACTITILVSVAQCIRQPQKNRH